MALTINSDRIKYTELEVYLKYDQLNNSDVVELLTQLDKLYNEIIEQSFPYLYRRPYFLEFYYPFRNILEVQSIETGQSIRFRFKEGWKPDIRIKKRELHIDVPKKLGIPVIVIYFLISGAQKYFELQNNILDSELKRLEIEMKRLEFYRELQGQRESEDFQRLQRQAERTIEVLIYNNSINHVEINGLTIKSENEK